MMTDENVSGRAWVSMWQGYGEMQSADTTVRVRTSEKYIK